MGAALHASAPSAGRGGEAMKAHEPTHARAANTRVENAMIDSVDMLPELVRKAFRKMDADAPRGYDVGDEWQTIRAELLRLAHNCEKFKDQVHDTCRRAERAESERNAALARIASAEVV